MRGSELLKQGELDDAIQAFHDALEVDPDSTKVLALLGLAHFRGGQFEDARPIYEQLVERAPTDASHRLNLGLVYLKLGDGSLAIDALEASRALDPSQGRAVSYLGLAYARAGRYAEAYRSFLLADQRELASEIETNLTSAERDGINRQLGRDVAPAAAPALARTLTPPGGFEAPLPASPSAPPPAAVALPRTATPPAGFDPAITPPSGFETATPPMGAVRTTPPLGTRTTGRIRAITSPPVAAEPPPAVARTTSPNQPTAMPRAITPHIVSRAVLEDSQRNRAEPRTRPPSAPPSSRRTQPVTIDLSTPEITVEPGAPEPTAPIPVIPPPPVSAAAAAAAAAAALDDDVVAGFEVTFTQPTGPIPRMTESQQFVMPSRDARDPRNAIPEVSHDGRSMVSLAVSAAVPAPPPPVRTPAGGTSPRPLSELATEELVRPADGDEPIELAANGSLILRITDRLMTRLAGVHATGGDLAFEPATRRIRGHQTEERFDHGASPLHVVTGRGYLVAVPDAAPFAAVALDDDILYLREDLVFAFEGSLRWENGHVPGLRGKLPVVQFRGDGAIALRLPRPLVRIKLPPQGMLLIAADRLAGWIGRVIPRAVVPPEGGPLGTLCVECTGEGIVLIEPAPPAATAPPLPVPLPLADLVADPVIVPSLPIDPSELDVDAPADVTPAFDPLADMLRIDDEL